MHLPTGLLLILALFTERGHLFEYTPFVRYFNRPDSKHCYGLCQGYHKIESLLYRDGDVQGAGIYADELVRDSEDLVKAFQDKTQFNASRTFDGIIDVATEIGAQCCNIWD